MHIISTKPLKTFWAEYPTAEQPLRAWITEAKRAKWANPAEMKALYPRADIVGPCTVFDIGGNKYRLVVWINYQTSRIYIRGIGTHEEYDGWNVEIM